MNGPQLYQQLIKFADSQAEDMSLAGRPVNSDIAGSIVQDFMTVVDSNRKLIAMLASPNPIDLDDFFGRFLQQANTNNDAHRFNHVSPARLSGELKDQCKKMEHSAPPATPHRLSADGAKLAAEIEQLHAELTSKGLPRSSEMLEAADALRSRGTVIQQDIVEIGGEYSAGMLPHFIDDRFRNQDKPLGHAIASFIEMRTKRWAEQDGQKPQYPNTRADSVDLLVEHYDRKDGRAIRDMALLAIQDFRNAIKPLNLGEWMQAAFSKVGLASPPETPPTARPDRRPPGPGMSA